MINVVLSLWVRGRDGVTKGKVVKEGSSTSSTLNSKVRKDKPSLHELACIKFRRTKPKAGLM